MDQSLHYRVDVCLPKTLNKTFLLAHLPKGVSESQWVAFAYYIVNRVFLSSLNKDFKITKSNGGRSRKWVSLPYSAFQGIGKSKYLALRQQLFDAGILECDGKYSYKNHETYGYRLGIDFQKQPIKFRTISNAAIEAVLLKQRRVEVEQSKRRIREIAFVAKGWLQPNLIQLDKSEALDFLELYESMMRRRLESRLSRMHAGEAQKEEQRWQAKNRAQYARRQVKKWGKQPHLVVDDKGGRFYTPFGLLLSPLRNFVTFNGEQLVSLDLKNSQPLHLLLLLDHRFWLEDSRLTWSLKRLNQELWKATRDEVTGSAQQGNPSLLMELKNPNIQVENEALANTHFAELVFSGKLYEFIADKFRGKYFTAQGADRFGTRDLAKMEMLRLMYFDNKKPHSPSQEPFEAFRKWFPVVARTMNILKSRDYRDFSILLQKLEANILLHNVCRSIYEKNTTAWFTTIHDAIVTTAEHADMVADVILTTYQKVLGTAPSLKRTDLHPDAAFRDIQDYVNAKLDQELGAATEEGKQLALSLAEIKARLQARDAQQELVTDDFPFGVDVAGMSIGTNEANPFAAPRRKLKK